MAKKGSFEPGGSQAGKPRVPGSSETRSPKTRSATTRSRTNDSAARSLGSGAAEDKPRVRRIGSLVSQLMSRRGYAQVAAGEEMHRSIVQVLGIELGGACQIGNLRAGVLQLYAADSVTLQELNFRKRAIIRQLQRDFPDNKLTDVRFRIQQK